MKFKKINIGLIALWFLFLTAATFWSVKEENKTLPSVWTEEAQEGGKAFLEKRKPRFQDYPKFP